MENILVINCGSSTIKWQIINIKKEEILKKGNIEKVIDHEKELSSLAESIKEYNIDGVGHRVVQGASIFNDSVIINNEIIKQIEKLSELAPLHNPPAVKGIKIMMKMFNSVEHIAVFDTSFHQTIPAENYEYAIPREWSKKYGVRKYGAHGTSYKFITKEAIKKLDKEKPNLVIAHIGSGASVCAIKEGKSFDTSMGFTPLEGLIMGTRSGDIDPTVVPFMAKKLDKTAQEIIDILNKESGISGFSNLENDARVITAAAKNGNEDAIIAMSMFTNRIIDYIAKYIVKLGNVDAVIFTAGIGENNVELRENIVKKLQIFNNINYLVIPTNEELEIANDVVRLSEK